MDLSIIILNYKTKGLVKQCIKGIELLNLDLDYEVIVVDNGSNDSCVEMIKTNYIENKDVNFKGSVELIESKENIGYTAGNNLGIRKAKGQNILILNPDITVLKGAIENMISYLQENESVGMVGPKLINPDGSVQLSAYRFPKWYIPILRRTILGKLPAAKKILAKYLMKDWDHDQNKPVEWLLGSGMMVKRRAFDKVGLMDERFFMYYSDVDWCRRFWQDSFAVYYLATAEMVHYHQRLSAEKSGIKSIFSKITRIHISDAFKYSAKYLGVNLPALTRV
ncbi:glycosyltransferase family 2 protein [Patescibacteria group bacterium]|nr:glycosyltransferase family 2 protein [Patescibacteria group bacterium]